MSTVDKLIQKVLLKESNFWDKKLTKPGRASILKTLGSKVSYDFDWGQLSPELQKKINVIGDLVEKEGKQLNQSYYQVGDAIYDLQQSSISEVKKIGKEFQILQDKLKKILDEKLIVWD